MINHGYLVHHGILGQKWGVRRYQNPDGSYTEAGKKRYSQGVYNQKEANEYANYLNKQGKYAHRYTTSSGPWSLPKHHVEEYTGDPNNLKDRKTQDKAIYDHWKKKGSEMSKRTTYLGDKYDRDNNKTLSGIDSTKKWEEYQKRKAISVGKALVKEYGEADVDNFINIYYKYSPTISAKYMTMVSKKLYS